MRLRRSQWSLLWVLCIVLSHQGCDTEDSDLLDRSPETLFVRFSEEAQGHRVPGITEALLGEAMTADQASISNRSYDFLENESGKLWYYHLAGGFEWESDASDNWKGCPNMDALLATEGDALIDLQETAVDFLLASGLIVLGDGEELRFEKKTAQHMGSGSVDHGDHQEYVTEVDLDFERFYLGQGFVGGGGQARVKLGCDGVIVGAEVMWRPILGVGLMPPDSAESLQAKWNEQLAGYKEHGLELVSADPDAAEIRWFVHGNTERQARALPYRITPAKFMETDLSPEDPDAQETAPTVVDQEVVVCIGDESLVDEGLMSISDLPNDHQDEEEPEEIRPPEDCDESTCF